MVCTYIFYKASRREEIEITTADDNVLIISLTQQITLTL